MYYNTNNTRKYINLFEKSKEVMEAFGKILLNLK